MASAIWPGMRFASRWSHVLSPLVGFRQASTKVSAPKAKVKSNKTGSKKKGKRGATGANAIPKELTQLRHALFTRPFKSGKEASLQQWVQSEAYTRIADAYYAEQEKRKATIVAHLKRQRERMAEACAALEKIDPLRFKSAMNRSPGDAHLIPMQKRMPVDTPPTTVWDEDYRPPPATTT